MQSEMQEIALENTMTEIDIWPRMTEISLPCFAFALFIQAHIWPECCDRNRFALLCFAHTDPFLGPNARNRFALLCFAVLCFGLLTCIQIHIWPRMIEIALLCFALY